MKNKTPWLQNGKFECRSCIALAAYIKEKTGIEAQVHKTERYLVFNFVKNGQMGTVKVDLRAGVLYCVQEDDLKPVLEAMK